MSRLDRPPFVLAFTADQQGCGFHRIMMPIASLYESGQINGRYDGNMWPVELAKAAQPDVVIWQRQVELDQIKIIQEWREALPDALFVYELDDYLGLIPSNSFHASFMPPQIERRISEAMAFCDRATTTTEGMAEWLRALGMHDVRVIPNGLPQARLKERLSRLSGKLRVGFAGGMSHSGDLELIRPAMETIGEDVTWVFLGMQPQDPPCRTEYYDGVPVFSYLDAMARLDCDVMLAPLEDNVFNRCKSNLRLVEAGAIGASVIAQDMALYHLDAPPVFAYAKTADDWTRAIQAFMATKTAERKKNASALMSWVGRKYTLDRLLPQRANAWLPDGERWKARTLSVSGTRPILSTSDIEDACERMPHLAQLSRISDGLETACRRALSLCADVLWLRPASVLSESGWHALRQTLAMSRDIASVVPLTADGPNAFPETDKWTLMPIDTAHVLDRLCREQFRGKHLTITVPSGPVVLLSCQALAMLGIPDVAGAGGNEEQALLEWGCRATKREWKNIQALSAYAVSVAQPAQPSPSMPLRLQARGYQDILQKPNEAITEDDREALELSMMREVWGGPRPGIAGFAGDYEAWSALHDVQLQKNLTTEHPSVVTIQSYGTCEPFTHDWVVFVDDTVELKDYAWQYFSEAARKAQNTTVDVLYADHETVQSRDKRAPEFKPEFDYELFLAQDYVTPICAIRKTALTHTATDKFELFRDVLRVAENKGAKGFLRVPHVLASVTVDPAPERQALDALTRQIIIKEELGDDVKVTAHKYIMGCLAVARIAERNPMVSIVVPTLGGSRLIQPCIATILQHTDYPNFEIVVVQNGPLEEPELLERTRNDPHVRVVHYHGTVKDGFNWSQMNNWAIRNHTIGELIVTMNDDCCVATKWWLDNMVGQVMQKDVGVVGARLLHPAGMIQHVGVICHNGIAGHMHKGLPNGYGGYLGRAFLTHEARAVTGACMLFRRTDFNRVCGFDEQLVHNYGDTKFCLDIDKLGYRNVVEMSAELLHPEAASRESTMSPNGFKRLVAEGKIVAKACSGQDRYWSPNLSIGMTQDGMGIQGLNGEALSWTDFPASADIEHVLLINDLPGTRGQVCELLQQGSTPFSADLSGFHLTVSAPHTLNVQPWDIRKPEQIAKGLQRLGIDRIILSSLVGPQGAAPPVETLRCLASIGHTIPVTVCMYEKALLAPFNDAEAIIRAKSIFGFVDFAAWEAAFNTLTNASEKEVVE